MSAKRRERRDRGVTLVDAMLAMAIVMIGGVGTLGLYRHQLAMNADARHMTEATALAKDLVENISLWSYGDARLVNKNTANDADLGDTARAFESMATPPYDYSERPDAGTSDLGTYNGLSARVPYQRFWNVSYVDDVDADGVWDAVRITVIVRWPTGTGSWRRIVLVSSKINPAQVL